MRIAVTADLHYGMRPAGDRAVEELAARIIVRAPDAVLIAGDVAVADPRRLVECLRLFSAGSAPVYVIPGNHDLWSHGAADSRAIFERHFTESVRLGGCRRLDGDPVAHGEVGIVGSIGWYDYTFADPRLDVPAGAYERKDLPGAGRWNDGRYIRWEYTDAGFTARVAAQLADDLARAREGVEAIVAVTHHLPFADLVPRHAHRGWMFANAFLGARRIGDVLRAEPKVALAVCGHSHERRVARVGSIHAESVGTTYTVKRALVFAVGRAGIVAEEPEEVRAERAEER